MEIRKDIVAALLGASMFASMPTAALGQSPAPARQSNLPAQDLASALRAVGLMFGAEVIFEPASVSGRTAPAIRGRVTLRQAIDELLRGTGLTADYRAGSVVVRGRDVAAPSQPQDAADAEIIVTGTHIRGGAPSAPPQIFSRREVEEQGFRDLGELARSIPQNFSGGQNPGVAGGGNQGSGNENSSSSSALNLRGLGPAATLTLMNGHRLAYDTVGQGVDLSQIPISAIDRIEIVTDGSSALYGADAIGGVANVILRRDHEGILASAQLGGSTDGGNTRHQYDVVTGHRWSSGGFMAAASYSNISAITAGQRDYTQTLNRTSTLVPRQRQFSVVLAGRQRLSDTLTLLLDGNANRHLSESANPISTTADVRTNGLLAEPKVRSATANIGLQWDVGGSWLVSANGTYGVSTNHVFSRRFSAGAEVFRSSLAYDNSVTVGEISAEGIVFGLPGGDARLALGGGYRDNRLDVLIRRTTAGVTRTLTDIESGRDVYYSYGELSLPFVTERNALPLLNQLRVNLAARYESYPRNASLLTPKVGLVYSPAAGLAVRANWGKSFRTQTLFQQYQAQQGALLPSAIFQSPPSTAPILILAGGNPDLQPERADTWTFGVTLTPAALPGFTMEASYFGIRYRDRVVSPFINLLGAFADPVYKPYVTIAPTAAAVSAVIATLPQGLSNQSGTAFDPASVGALVDGTLQNAARQNIRGVDLVARYRIELNEGSIRLDGSANYIDSDQQLSPRRPALPLAGTIFNPPHWRGRAGATWQQEQVTLSAFGSRIGGTRDTRYTPATKVKGFTSFDLVGQVRSSASRGALSGITVGVSILNLFNAKPSSIRNPIATDPPYDSTNYPAAGRIVALSLTKAFQP